MVTKIKLCIKVEQENKLLCKDVEQWKNRSFMLFGIASVVSKFRGAYMFAVPITLLSNQRVQFMALQNPFCVKMLKTYNFPLDFQTNENTKMRWIRLTRQTTETNEKEERKKWTSNFRVLGGKENGLSQFEEKFWSMSGEVFVRNLVRNKQIFGCCSSRELSYVIVLLVSKALLWHQNTFL